MVTPTTPPLPSKAISFKTAAAFNYEAKDEYTIRVKGTDSGGLSIEKTFTLNVTDGPDTPSEILLSNSTVDENQKKGATVGNLGAMDEDAGEKHTYRLVDIPVDPDHNPNAEILPNDNLFFTNIRNHSEDQRDTRF